MAQTAFLLLRFRVLQGQLELARYREAAGELWAAREQDGRFVQMLAATDHARLFLTDVK